LKKEKEMKKRTKMFSVIASLLVPLVLLSFGGKTFANEEGVLEAIEAVEVQGPYTPDPNTIALWHLDGNGNDASSNGNNLYVREDKVDWVTGYYGGAVLMNANEPWAGNCSASDGYPALNALGYGTTYYSGTGDMTIEAWVKFDSISKEYKIFTDDPAPWGSMVPYCLSINSGTGRFYISDDYNGWDELEAPVSDQAGIWFHIAAVYTYHSKMQIYINGKSKAKKSTTIIPASNSGPDHTVYVGGTYCGTSNGLNVDEMRISNIARKYRGKKSLISEIEE
jgi:hypothetical protein